MQELLETLNEKGILLDWGSKLVVQQQNLSQT